MYGEQILKKDIISVQGNIYNNVDKIPGEPFAIWHGHEGQGFHNSNPTASEDYHVGYETITSIPRFKSFKYGATGAVVANDATTIFPMYQNVDYNAKPITGYFLSIPMEQYGVFKHKGVKLKTKWQN